MAPAHENGFCIYGFCGVLAPHDALVLPTTANTPPRIADLADDKAFTKANLLSLRNCTLINMIDGCAISLPAVLSGPSFATDVAPPADFVVKSRQKREPDYIPIFQPPPEPARPVLNDKELKATQGDLDSIEKQHDAIRQAFPPSAKAMAEQQAAAKTAKSKPPAANQ